MRGLVTIHVSENNQVMGRKVTQPKPMLQSLEMSSRFSIDGRKEGGSGCLKICLAGRTRWRARSALAVIELINSWRTDRQNCCLAARNPLVVVGTTVCLGPLERWRGSNPFPSRACQKPEAALSTKNPTSNDALPPET